MESKQAWALDCRPHLETEHRVTQRGREGDQDEDGHHDGGQLDAVDGRAGNVEDHRVDVEEQARRRRDVTRTHQDGDEGWQTHHEPEGGDGLRRHVAGRDPREDESIDEHAEQRREHQDRKDARQCSGHAVGCQLRIRHCCHIGLGTEGEVEDPGRLVAEHEPDRHERERAAIGDAGQRVAERLAHLRNLTCRVSPVAAEQVDRGRSARC